MRFVFSIAAVVLLPVAFALPQQLFNSNPTTSPTGLAKRVNNFNGDLTYYEIGLGSCGVQNDDSQAVVALAVDMMQNGANPNVNPLCGQTITISYNGVTKQAAVMDTCQACATDDVDASPSLFSDFAPEADGRLSGVSWWFDSTADGSRPS